VLFFSDELLEDAKDEDIALLVVGDPVGYVEYCTLNIVR
jgi:diphthamide biosynthesis methyltransferase